MKSGTSLFLVSLHILIITLLSNQQIFAQVNNLNLTLSNGKKIAQGSIEKLVGDSTKISSLGPTQWIKVDSLIEIKLVKKSKFWKRAGIGFSIGGTFGGAIASVTYEKPAPTPGSFNIESKGLNTFGGVIFGSFTGTLVGGIIGASSGKDKVYDLSQKNLEQKLEIIQSIIAKKTKDRKKL
ncbi:hypothetical protein H8E88_11410 [candidate division KSB1 bacterium]|nr:hypothetical protein [candidate division KSB1 bacterium]